MVRIFGKKRFALIDGKKLRKYLLYAIGEILLVVIGILLALYINNRSQAFKAEKKMEILLDEVNNDLSIFIRTSKNQLNFYSDKRDILYLILNNDLTYDDYVNRTYPNMERPTTWYSGGGKRKIAYNNLISEINSVPLKYSSIMNQLSSFYNNSFTERYIDLIEEVSIENERKRVDSFPWYSYYDPEKENVEKINYLVNDPLYRNEVLYYYQLVNHHCGFILNDMLLAEKIYKDIHEMKGIDVDLSKLNIEIDNTEALLGKWAIADADESLIEIKKIDDKIVFQQVVDTTFYPLYSISKTKLIDDDTFFWELENIDSSYTLKIGLVEYKKVK